MLVNNYGAWAGWTPTFTNVSGGTTNYAKYTQIGKTVFFRIKYTFAGAGVSGAITFSPPITLNSEYAADDLITTGRFVDSGVAFYSAALLVASTTALKLRPVNAAGTYDTSNAETSSTVPFTWGNLDSFMVMGFYEGV